MLTGASYQLGQGCKIAVHAEHTITHDKSSSRHISAKPARQIGSIGMAITLMTGTAGQAAIEQRGMI